MKKSLTSKVNSLVFHSSMPFKVDCKVVDQFVTLVMPIDCLLVDYLSARRANDYASKLVCFLSV